MFERVKQVLSDALLAEANWCTVGIMLIVLISGGGIIFFVIRYKEKLGVKITSRKKTFACLLWVYICGLMYITFFNRATGERAGFRFYVDLGNVFGDDIEKKEFWYSLFNVLLFVPYGFIWCVLLSRQRLRLVFTTLISLSTTITIEILQLIFRKGYFELSDIICNVCGAALGGVSCLLIEQILKSSK